MIVESNIAFFYISINLGNKEIEFNINHKGDLLEVSLPSAWEGECKKMILDLLANFFKENKITGSQYYKELFAEGNQPQPSPNPKGNCKPPLRDSAGGMHDHPKEHSNADLMEGLMHHHNEALKHRDAEFMQNRPLKVAQETRRWKHALVDPGGAPNLKTTAFPSPRFLH